MDRRDLQIISEFRYMIDEGNYRDAIDLYGDAIDQIRSQEEEISKLRAAVKYFANNVSSLERSGLEQWEHMAEWFYSETGMLRPGKDYPALAILTPDYDERLAAWNEWIRNKCELAEGVYNKLLREVEDE